MCQKFRGICAWYVKSIKKYASLFILCFFMDYAYLAHQGRSIQNTGTTFIPWLYSRTTNGGYTISIIKNR